MIHQMKIVSWKESCARMAGPKSGGLRKRSGEERKTRGPGQICRPCPVDTRHRRPGREELHRVGGEDRRQQVHLRQSAATDCQWQEVAVSEDWDCFLGVGLIGINYYLIFLG